MIVWNKNSQGKEKQMEAETISVLALAFSFISLGVSIAVIIRTLFQERFSVDFSLIKYFPCGFDTKYPGIFVDLCIVNNSKLPISILSIEIIDSNNNSNFSSGEVKEIYRSSKSSNSKKTEEIIFNSVTLPIFIESFSAKSGYIHITTKQHWYSFEEREFTFIVHTNRGDTKKQLLFERRRSIYRKLQLLSGESPVLKDSLGNEIEYI